MPWKKFQILFRNLQVINWHKYKDSTNKNGHRRMVLAEQAARIFPIFDINKVLPNFRRSFLWHDSFLLSGRHGGVQLVQQKKSDWWSMKYSWKGKIYNFHFQGLIFVSHIEFPHLKVRQIATQDLHFIICWWQWRWLCQIYSPAVLIYTTRNPTQTRPGTRTFNHYPTRTCLQP